MIESDLFISTFIIGKEDNSKIATKLKKYQEFDVIKLPKSRSHPELESLKYIVSIAKKNKDDAIFIIVGNDISFVNYDRLNFFHSIFEISELNIPILIFDGQPSQDLVHVKENLFFVTQINELNTFILLSNMFDVILELNEDSFTEFPTTTIENVINLPFLRKVMDAKWNSEGNEVLMSKINKCLLYQNKQRINLVIPFRNAEKYLKECCDSILSQSHTNWRVFFIDDCSSDNSIAQIPEQSNFTIIRNKTRNFSMKNVHHVLTQYDFTSEDIVSIFDGDDMLDNDYSLGIVNNVYSDNKNCLMSYGRFVVMNSWSIHGSVYNEAEFRALRQSMWKNFPLRTFKYKVYCELLQQDPEVRAFKHTDETFYEMTSDMALMFPLMEISGFENIYNIPYPLYSYRLYEGNDHIVNRHLQYKIELEIRQKTRFKEKKFN